MCLPLNRLLEKKTENNNYNNSKNNIIDIQYIYAYTINHSSSSVTEGPQTPCCGGYGNVVWDFWL